MLLNTKTICKEPKLARTTHDQLKLARTYLLQPIVVTNILNQLHLTRINQKQPKIKNETSFLDGSSVFVRIEEIKTYWVMIARAGSVR